MNRSGISRFFGTEGLLLAVLGAGCLLRFIYLNADPYYDIWIGYITDEGRWVQKARSLALFGELNAGLRDPHLLLAPAFQFVNYLIFESFGVSRVTSRLFTALCGTGILLLVWMRLRPIVSPQALLLGLILLALQPTLLILARISIPELAAFFFALLAYFAIVSNDGSALRLISAGLLVVLAMSMKATVAPVAAIFSVMILLMPRRGSGLKPIGKWQSLLWFWLGMLAPLMVALAIGVACCSSHLVSLPSTLSTQYVPFFSSFLRPTTVYAFMAFPFADPMAPTLNILALGLWISGLAWLASSPADLDFWSRRYLATSAIWACLSGFVMLLIAYYPSRYSAQIAIPMIINLIVGISLFQRLGFRAIVDSITTGSGVCQVLRIAVLGVPVAVFIAPLLGYAFGLPGADAGSLRIKLASALIAWIAAAFVIYRTQDRPRIVGAVLLFPLIGGVSWMALSVSPIHAPFWPGQDSGNAIRWLLFLLLAWIVAAASVALVYRRPEYGARLFHVSAAVMLLALAAEIAPGYISPHYTLETTSRALGNRLAGAASVGSFKGNGLFNDNSLRYSIQYRRLAAELPQFLVVVFAVESLEKILATHYHLVKTYHIYVAPNYYEGDTGNGPVGHLGEPVRVYKRVDPGKTTQRSKGET